MKIKKIIICLLFVGLVQALLAQKNAKPVYYWSFNGSNPLADSIDSKNLLKANGTINYARAMAGKAIDIQQSNSLESSKTLFTTENGLCQKVSIAFLYQVNLAADNVSMSNLLNNNSFQMGLYTQNIRWKTFHKDKKTHIWEISLDSVGRYNLNYYLDERFHHWVFTFDSEKGAKQLWIDGVLLAEVKDIPVLKIPLAESGITYLQHTQESGKNHGKWDEIAFYNAILSPNYIRKQWVEAQQGKAFSFVETGNFDANNPAILKNVPSPKYDIKEFAPGHPNANTSAIAQLQSYPAPRFKPFHQVHRNVNSMVLRYPKTINAVNEVPEIYVELAKNWNYYLTVMQNIAFPPPQVQIQQANENPWFPLMISSGWGFVNQKDKNPMGEKGPYIKSAKLPKSHYLMDKNGQFLTGRKIWSPASPLDSIQKDGEIQRSYFQKYIAPSLKRPIDLINENGEVFAHPYKDSLLMQDPNVVKDKQTHFPKWDWYTYQSYRRYQADSTYKSSFLNHPLLKNAEYFYYEIDGERLGTRYQYAQTRKIHPLIRNTYYATHSFYPTPHALWATTSGWRNGWNYSMIARSVELSLGDKWFCPFITTGFSENEEKNMRPGRWLGLMKALSATGAEFYHNFFYTEKNVSNPANYIWNGVTPSYVQAILSRYTDVFWQGNVLEGDVKNPENGSKTPLYRFWTGNPNHLVVIRKHNTQEKYVIVGTIQPTQLSPDAAPRAEVVSIFLNSETLTFEIRQQGSTYIYEKTEGKTLFYQLDKWHQYEHLSWWSKNIAMEAEVLDSVANGKAQIYTERPSKAATGDFSAFVSYISANKGAKIAYFFQPRNIPEHNQFALKVRARVKDGGNANLGITFDANSLDYKQPNVYTGKKKQANDMAISGSEWKWYTIDSKTKAAIVCKGFQPDTPQTLWLAPSSDKIEIDEIVLEAGR